MMRLLLPQFFFTPSRISILPSSCPSCKRSVNLAPVQKKAIIKHRITMTSSSLQEAERYWKLGYNALLGGRIDEAVEFCRRSIELYPTAEGHTYLGWSLSYRGQLEEAIEECKQAIGLDPDFGNPYNDIGSSLITLRRSEEAIPWLKLATKAERYESRHFPHHNLGRIYERTGEFQEALRQYQQSLRHQPDYKPALQASERLIAWMN